MPISENRSFWVSAVFFSITFAMLMMIRLDLHGHFFKKANQGTQNLNQGVHPGESWMILLQHNKKIGFSHRTIENANHGGYRVWEKTVMRLNTMGMIQDLSIISSGTMNQDFSIRDFDFRVISGRFDIAVTGYAEGNRLIVKTKGESGISRPVELEFDSRPYLAMGIIQAALTADLKQDEELVLTMVDPVTLGEISVIVKSMGQERLGNGDNEILTRKLSLSYQGATQYAWVDDKGNVIREEGMLGITLVLADKKSALNGLPISASDDLTALAAIPSNKILNSPSTLTRLKVKLFGIDPQSLSLQGIRQNFSQDVLTIEKESLDGITNTHDIPGIEQIEDRFRSPGLFIGSDHPRIMSLAEKITLETDTPFQKIKKTMDWMKQNIQRQPVVSLPDAVATLENGMGDCNEHAVLFAALCRAMGIPAKVEAGLVYLNGSFYYHAWNSVYLGRWITADSLFQQIPADVTHIRLVSGTQEMQLGLAGVIGKLKLEITHYD